MALERATEGLLAAIRRAGRLVTVAAPGSEELRYLDYFGAEASVNATAAEEPYASIIVRDPPLKAALLEEFLHGTQARLGVIDRLGVQGAEAHVKRFMIRHRRLLGLGAEDVSMLESLLERGF